VITLLVVYTLPLYIGLAWMAEPFIGFVYGERWLLAAEPLRIIAMAGLLICIGHPCGAVLAAQNRLGREVWVHASHALVVAAGCYIGLRWGIAGAAWAVFIGLVYSTAIMYYLATRCFRTTLGDLGRALAPGIKLNTLLLAALAISHSLLPTDLRSTCPALYMLIVGGGGGLVYAAAFLLHPTPALATEAERWRKTFRLVR
jgi:O-antigen/teichoic acid export membrane protein